MKYLKTYSQRELHYNKILETKYNLSDYVELPQEIQDELHDICLELTDDKGFKIMIETILSCNGNNYTILYITKQEFEFDKIKDVIERIEDYMNSMGYNCAYDHYDLPNINTLFNHFCISHLYITFIKK